MKNLIALVLIFTFSSTSVTADEKVLIKESSHALFCDKTVRRAIILTNRDLQTSVLSGEMQFAYLEKLMQYIGIKKCIKFNNDIIGDNIQLTFMPTILKHFKLIGNKTEFE
jgi:hypothetical protein